MLMSFDLELNDSDLGESFFGLNMLPMMLLTDDLMELLGVSIPS